MLNCFHFSPVLAFLQNKCVGMEVYEYWLYTDYHPAIKLETELLALLVVLLYTLLVFKLLK